MAINKMNTQYMEEAQRPLDFLNSMKGQRVLVESADQVISGVLVSFDIHINLVLKQAQDPQTGKAYPNIFIRGENVKTVSA